MNANARRRPFEVLGFDTTHDALAAEEVLKEAGFDVVPIPTPPTLGTLCGISLRVPPDQAGAAVEALSGAGLAPLSQASIEDV